MLLLNLFDKIHLLLVKAFFKTSSLLTCYCETYELICQAFEKKCFRKGVETAAPVMSVWLVIT